MAHKKALLSINQAGYTIRVKINNQVIVTRPKRSRLLALAELEREIAQSITGYTLAI